jgi:uncharacterized Rmd1/YagE family protein
LGLLLNFLDECFASTNRQWIVIGKAEYKRGENVQGLVELSQWHERYMVAFQYGSIVFFNFGDEEEEEALSAMRKFCTDEFRETRKDGILCLCSSRTKTFCGNNSLK